MLLDKDVLLAAINAIPDASPVLSSDQVVVLQQQVSDLQAKMDAASKAMQDEQSKEVDLQTSLDAANSKIAQVKIALGL